MIRGENMNKVKISVIIPVYNDEDLVGYALDSVLNQTLKEVEIICVNDGSTDNSLKVLNEYKEKYPDQIKVFTQKNQGSGIARNKGMNYARGEYISFLDSDDFYLDEDALEKMYGSAIKNDAKVVSGNLKVLLQNGDFVTNNNVARFNEEKIIQVEEYGIPYQYIKNIFKTDFIKENNFCFPDLLRGQDPVFFAEILTSVDKMAVVPTDLYAVRSTGTDYKKVSSYRKKFDYIKHFKCTIDILKGANFNSLAEQYKQQLYYYLNSPELDNEDKIEIQKIVEDVFKDDYDILKECSKSFINPKVSLIIPVYNVGEFLEESIGSILNQTLPSIELVCVNDGSKDNSLEILQKFAKDDPRVKIIDQPNAGCGAARNKALDNARGEYIYFFDPDDYILPNTLEELYNNAVSNDSDFVVFKIASFIDGHPINYNSPGFAFDKIFENRDFNNFTFTYKDVKRHVLLSAFAPWSKFYKKSFLDKYPDFRFHRDVAFDDVPFHVQSMLRASRISFIPKYFYHYRLSNPNSVNNTSSNAPDILRIIDIVEDFLKTEGFYEEFKEEFIIFKIIQMSTYISSSGSEDYFNVVKQNIIDLDFNNTDVPESILRRNNTLKFYRAVINSNSIEEYERNLRKQDTYYLQRELENRISQNKILQSKIDDLNKEIESLKEDINSRDLMDKKVVEENIKLNRENSVLKERIIFFNKKNEYMKNNKNNGSFYKLKRFLVNHLFLK